MMTITSLRNNACKAFSCEPTKQRRYLANGVLVCLAFVVMALIGVIHAGTLAGIAKDEQRAERQHAPACAVEPARVEARAAE